ncbi:RNA polymerase sigma factor (sigma-70 family) [Orbus hercynius]|uniref:RNA polymerase sigma factor (Sigma-70 family) n=1 Tax=Orbus hercynius TaxID=593135 RepID=A0A495RHS4_9GAMM|nr:sigma-70 family RNA polymerase sigma factor [Orbus hercynius]RKS87083.1 RNA polymerase sigma factor (sigma-70 family) [Orbus hercynius]
MDFFYDGKHTITCDNQQTASYLCGVGFVTHYMDELHVTGKIDTTTSIHLDIKTAEQHLNRMYGFNIGEYHELKETVTISQSDVNYKGVFTSLKYAKQYIEKFYEENYKKLRKFAKNKMYTNHLNVSHIDCEDIVQQAFLKLLDRKLTKPVYELMPYMKTTITNLINDELRKNQNIKRLALENFIPSDVICTKEMTDNDYFSSELDDFVLNNKEDELIESTIRRHYPQILIPHLIDGYTIKETSNRANMSERTIKYELDTLKNKLQKVFKN